MVILLVAVLVGSVALPAVHLAPAHAQETDVAGAEGEFVARINELRRSKGLRSLETHGELVTVARRWAEHMARADEISHNPDLARQVSADWQKLGENVGVGMTVAKLHDAFVRSPSHYRNLVDGDFTHVGVAVVVGRDGALFTTHQFMELRGKAKPAPATAPPAVVERPDEAAVDPVPELVAAPRPTGRLVLVLQQLRALDVS